MCKKYPDGWAKEPAKCRAQQLLEASQRIIDHARAMVDPSMPRSHVMTEIYLLRQNVAIFDRLNRGL